MADPVKLGKYEIKARLGRGAMGVLYKGFDPAIKRTVALKTIRRDILDHDKAEELLARFKREAEAAGRLSHANIVTVFEYGEDNDTVYIAMEYVEGRDLKEILNSNQRFTVETAVSIMSQLLDALAYSHRQGVVHRDIKPANIILLADGTVKITDFGIAHLESSSLTQYGEVLGTPSYMSPEQCMGDAVDSRTDLFSAGIIMYQLLTAEKPFPGEAMTTIMHRVVNTEPLKPSELNFKIPSALDQCVVKALAKNPADRFQTADEFLQAIRAIDPAKIAAAGTLRETESVTVGDRDQETLLADQQTVALESGSVPPGPTAKTAVGQRQSPGLFSFLQNKAAMLGIGIVVIVSLVLTVAILVKGPEQHPESDADGTPKIMEPQKEKSARGPEAPARKERKKIRLTTSPMKGKEETPAPSPKPVRGIRPKVID